MVIRKRLIALVLLAIVLIAALLLFIIFNKREHFLEANPSTGMNLGLKANPDTIQITGDYIAEDGGFWPAVLGSGEILYLDKQDNLIEVESAGDTAFLFVGDLVPPTEKERIFSSFQEGDPVEFRAIIAPDGAGYDFELMYLIEFNNRNASD